MARILYALYVRLIFAPVFIVLTMMAALATIVGCMLGGKRIFSYYPGMIWARLACRLALCPVRIRGSEHVQRSRPAVYVANHQGAVDIFLIFGFLGVPVKWVMKLGLVKIPFVGAACRAAGFVFVNHKTLKAATESLIEAERLLQAGSSIFIFPEGSRTTTGKMGRFKKGAFQIAVNRRVPVIPITLNGPFDALPIGSLNLRRRPLEIVVHPPILTESSDASHESVRRLADEAFAVISSALWEPYAG
ncbi:MAG: 1-acyl-sn-glycerol-3-phosphate acyltransferase [Tannerellaceae bacterium]|jgi:1-acyl-sn-glycerol-3-phosphate acyltransferase|nr:1-acyl-sn-glycerol-3-phosphate acyltransferase [Tannerellaceae bacterium]